MGVLQQLIFLLLIFTLKILVIESFSFRVVLKRFVLL